MDVIATHADRHPERAALIEGDRRLSWAELRDARNRLAHSLVGLGISRGEHVVLYAHNGLDVARRLGRGPGSGRHSRPHEPSPHRRRGRLHPREFGGRGGIRGRRLRAHGGRRARPIAQGARLDPARGRAPRLGRPLRRPRRGGPDGAGGAARRRGVRGVHYLHRGDHRQAQGRAAARVGSQRAPAAARRAQRDRSRARPPRGGPSLSLGPGWLRLVRAALRQHRGRHAQVRRRGGARHHRAAPLQQHVHGADAPEAHRRPAGRGAGALRRLLHARDRDGGGAMPHAREGGRDRLLRAVSLRVLRLDGAGHQYHPRARRHAAKARLLRQGGAGRGACRPRRRGPPRGDGAAGELHVRRHPGVFDEYYKNPDATRQTGRGDWLSVGDVAYLDDEGSSTSATGSGT